MLSGIESYRPLLFSIAYRMTGSAADAEDLVQETFLRAARADEGSIENPRAWLASVVTNLALDLLKSARRNREEYVGPWLPEPIVVEGREERDLEMISFAFMTLLETLAPEERAVLILRDVFQYEFDEVAGIVGKSAANCRQILHRARTRLAARKPRFEPSKEEHWRLVDGFLASMRSGDPGELAQLLAPDVTSWSDGGGKVNAARRPIEGREAVTRFLLGLRRLAPATWTTRTVEINGLPAVAGFLDGQLFNTIAFDVRDGLIRGIRIVVNPDKLAYLRLQLQADA